MKLADIIGQDLDEKYRIESEIGRGGMGTVYLATHLGTERPVAVKIVSPQFMKRPEFVERFRREARAAGRLRHPNVVDVTDFGFAATDDGQVAYLVMEYLDGCTLGEVLDEENRLPVGWVLDIVDQICSAVHEAHEQGIIHRDLKPDNIWLEPNQRGGYTVKVLDFGIAKLEEGVGVIHNSDVAELAASITRPTVADGGSTTHGDGHGLRTIVPEEGGTSAGVVPDATLIGESRTLIQSADNERTAILPVSGYPDKSPASIEGADPDSIDTKMIETGDHDRSGTGEREPYSSRGFSQSLSSTRNITGGGTTNLTKVGAVLGTPLYMSPEQCRGETLDARSDIYSIGIIIYQMLSGATPFDGDWKDVMEAHKLTPPPPLNAKKVRRKLKRVIMSSIEKNPNDRPQTAQALAIALRSRAEGIFGLIRRAGMIYTEHMPKFIFLSTFFALPIFALIFFLLLNTFLQFTGTISRGTGSLMAGTGSTIASLISAFCTYLTIGTICWIVTQMLAVPLRPLSLRRALKVAAGKWRTFAGTGLFTTVMSFVIGGVVGIIAFLLMLLLLWPVFGFGTENYFGSSAILGVTAGFLAFFIFSVLMMLLGPVVMMEDLRGFKAMRRSAQLVRRSYVTSFSAFAITFVMPLVTAGILSAGLQLFARSVDPSLAITGTKVSVNRDNDGAPTNGNAVIKTDADNDRTIRIDQTGVTITEEGPAAEGAINVRNSLKRSVLESLLQILLLPIQIIIVSFTAIMIALLYLKTRQAGGESLQGLLYHFAEGDGERKQWQKRVHKRLIQSGRITPKA